MTSPRRPGSSRRGALAALLLAPTFARAQALPGEVLSELPGARLQGSGRLRFLGLRVYDIRMWSAARVPRDDAWASVPLALEIQYARALVGKLIAERSIDEMRRQGPIADDKASRWLAAMTATFPDVKEGDRLTGVHRPGEAARFHFNAAPVGELRDPEFARLFFGIWLSARTSEPALRDALLGTATP